MIDRLEIMEFSREVGLRPDVVEKDYVLVGFWVGYSTTPSCKRTGFSKAATV